MSRGAVAAFRLELRRRWILLLFLFGVLLCLAAVTPLVRGGAAVLVALPAALVGLLGVAAAWGTVAADRLQGRFEPFRGLPVPLTRLAHGRLVAVAAWAVTVPLGLVPTLVALHGAGVLPLRAAVVALWLGVLWVVAALVATWMSALTARWPIERVIGGVMGLGYLVVLAGWPRLERWALPRLRLLGDWLLANAATPVAAGAALGMALAVLAVAWWPAVRLLAWGMQVAPAGPPERAGALARRDPVRPLAYPRGQRHPALAVMALQLRLAMERIPRQLLLIVATMAVVPFLPAAIRGPALIYLRVLAVALPASVAARIALARSEGTLEPLAALPVGRGTVATGAFLAILLLAVPAAALVAGATAVARGGELDPLLLVRSWGALAGSTMLAAGTAAWLTPRALAALLGAAGLVVGGGMLVLLQREAEFLPLLVALAEWLAAAVRHPATLVLPLVIGGGIGWALLVRGVGRGPR